MNQLLSGNLFVSKSYLLCLLFLQVDPEFHLHLFRPWVLDLRHFLGHRAFPKNKK